MNSDHYALLGLPSGEEGARLSDKEITKAYRRKALELHPDKRPNDANAKIYFQNLKASYEILKDVNARKQYDDQLQARAEQEEELASMYVKRCAAATPPMPPAAGWNWTEETEDGAWKSMRMAADERQKMAHDLMLQNMRRAAERQQRRGGDERQKMAQDLVLQNMRRAAERQQEYMRKTAERQKMAHDLVLQDMRRAAD